MSIVSSSSRKPCSLGSPAANESFRPLKIAFASDRTAVISASRIGSRAGVGRYEVADELLHADLLDHNRMEGQPDGRAGDVWAADMIRRAFPDLRFVADLVLSDGEYVVGRWTMTETNTRPFELFGLPPTGRPVTMTGQEVGR